MKSHSNLTLIQPTPEYASKTCGPYWYLIHENGMSFTAFSRREALILWMDERGLTLSRELAPSGTYDVQRINGEFFESMHSSYDEFYSLHDAIKASRIMSNGDYTTAIITEAEGIRCVNYLNPNCRHRPQFDYAETRAIYC